MNPFELAFALLLVALLLGLAFLFAWRQWQTLQRLRNNEPISGEDRSYFVTQVRRRLLGSVLMVFFAGFLIGSLLLDEQVRQFVPTPAEEKGDEVQPNEASKEFLRFFTAYWICALMVLLGIMVLATLDFIATARFGARHQRQLLSDHRAILESEATRLRQRRQEMN